MLISVRPQSCSLAVVVSDPATITHYHTSPDTHRHETETHEHKTETDIQNQTLHKHEAHTHSLTHTSSTFSHLSPGPKADFVRNYVPPEDVKKEEDDARPVGEAGARDAGIARPPHPPPSPPPR